MFQVVFFPTTTTTATIQTKEMKKIKKNLNQQRWVFLAVSIVRALHDTVISQRSSLKYGQQLQQQE